MGFLQFLRSLFGRKPRRSAPKPASDKRPNDGDESAQTRKINLENPTAQTAANVLVLSLRALDSMIVEQIQQTSANEQSLAQLAARIDWLTPIVTQTAEDDPLKGQGIVEKLQKELAWMAEQLNAVKATSELDQFFNSADNSILRRLNAAFDQIIGDCTFLTIHEIAKSLRELENSKLQQPNPDITGGTGGTGGSGHIGGAGGEGGGPQIDMDPDKRAQMGNVSGGIGGTGGVGVAVGERAELAEDQSSICAGPEYSRLK
ncbi:hypothetical protein MSAN_01874200 [Mycena sanguinolenta]|uniref:Uncharacterized protein n=1 Tax=Mycena sanguinolenta TaxID=230812 RepID=A0A8H6XU62_9AGAR|nr:hypothetical protein MSAN_01874200 [Mycena sanguinolenta]